MTSKGKLTVYGVVQKSLMYDDKLHPYAKLIYAFLTVHQKHTGDTVYPSINLITTKLKISRPSCIKYINELESAGWIEKIKSSGKTNRYMPLHEFLSSESIPVNDVDYPSSVKEVYNTDAGPVNDVDYPSSVKEVYNTDAGPVNDVDYTSKGGLLVPVNDVYPKKHNIKKQQKETLGNTDVLPGVDGVMHAAFIDKFCNWYKENFSTKYEWGPSPGKEMKHMKDLRKKFLEKIKEYRPEKIEDTEYCANAFYSFLTQIQNKWVLENLEPSIINMKFNSIYASITGKQSIQSELSGWVVRNG